MDHYNIHDLVAVIVAPSLPAWVRRAIDFQIAEFRTNDQESLHGLPRITVHPYAEFSDGNTEAFHTARGIPGRQVDDGASRLALSRTGSDIDVFTDGTDFLINFYIQLAMTDRGACLIHAAGVVDEGGEALLVAGPGGIGKTAIVSKLVAQGWRVLGDDVVVVSHDGRCLAFPRGLVIKESRHSPTAIRFAARVRRAVRSVAGGLLDLLRTNAPFVGLIKWLLERVGLRAKLGHRIPSGGAHPHQIPLRDAFGSRSLAREGTIRKIVYLTRAVSTQARWSVVTPEVLAERLTAVIHHEWWSVLRHLTILGAFGIVDISHYLSAVSNTIVAGVGSAQLQTLTVPESWNAEELVAELMRGPSGA